MKPTERVFEAHVYQWVSELSFIIVSITMERTLWGEAKPHSPEYICYSQNEFESYLPPPLISSDFGQVVQLLRTSTPLTVKWVDIIQTITTKGWQRKEEFIPLVLSHCLSWDLSCHRLLPLDWDLHHRCPQAFGLGLNYPTGFPESPACRQQSEDSARMTVWANSSLHIK